MYNKRAKTRMLIVATVATIIPFSVFFCYNLGKYEEFSETVSETVCQYLPLVPAFVIVFILLLVRKAK